MKRIIVATLAVAFLAVVSAFAQTTHTESTAKSNVGGKKTKVKTETVTGTVKEYAAGKKITVTGPKKKDYSFDLDENASMKGTVAVGDRVKVSYTKSDGGNKVTVVAPYATKSKVKKAAA